MVIPSRSDIKHTERSVAVFGDCHHHDEVSAGQLPLQAVKRASDEPVEKTSQATRLVLALDRKARVNCELHIGAKRKSLNHKSESPFMAYVTSKRKGKDEGE